MATSGHSTGPTPDRRVLLDTDILSEIIKGRDRDVAAHATAYLNEHQQFTTSADLERRGLVIGMPDVMIAAIALQSGLPLVTGNLGHFGYVRAVGYDLAVETWRASR